MTLSCGENGGINVTRCKDECGGSQCENWLASEECTVHLGSCAETTPVAPVDTPVDNPITAPVGNSDPISTPSDSLQNSASYFIPAISCITGVAVLVV